MVFTSVTQPSWIWPTLRSLSDGPYGAGLLMATFGRVFSSIWTDPEFTALTTACQHLYVLMVSSASRNHAGVLPMTLRRWSKCSADATTESVRAALEALAEARFVVIDWDTEEVLVRTYIRNDGVWKQPKVMVSALRSALTVGSDAIKKALAEEIVMLSGYENEKAWQETVKALLDTPSEGYPQGYPEGYPLGLGVGVGEGVVVKPSFKKEGNRNSAASNVMLVPLRDSTIAVTNETRTIVHAIVKGAVLKANRDGLYGHTQKLLDDGATPEQMHAVLEEWSRRPDAYPGHIPHIYTEMAKRAAGGSDRRPQSKSRDWATLKNQLRAAENNTNQRGIK